MDKLYVYGLAALIAAVIKAIILAQTVTRSKLTSAFNLVVIALILQNLFEFLTFISFENNPQLADLMLCGVLASLIVVAAGIFSFSCTLQEVNTDITLQRIVWLFAVLLLGTALSGYLIEGAVQSGYSIISIEGPAYPLFRTYAVLVLALTVWKLRLGLKQTQPMVAARSKLALLAVLPILGTGVGILALRMAGFASTSAIVMPLASTFFVWILMHDERGDIVTFRFKWRLSWFFLRLSCRTALSRRPQLDDYWEQVEKIRIEEAMRCANNNMAEAGKLIGASRSTISRRCKYFGIWTAEERAG